MRPNQISVSEIIEVLGDFDFCTSPQNLPLASGNQRRDLSSKATAWVRNRIMIMKLSLDFARSMLSTEKPEQIPIRTISDAIINAEHDCLGDPG